MIQYRHMYAALGIICAAIIALADDVNKVYNYDTVFADIIIVVLSQPNIYHANRARQNQIDLMNQMVELGESNNPAVYLTHKKWPGLGTWTIFPLLKEWNNNFSDRKWVLFCEEDTRINLKKLEKFVKKFDPTKDWFIGHALSDKEPTIIHHFTQPDKLKYPDFAAGVLLSFPLINKLVARWPDELNFRADFAIDPKHELASYIILDNVSVTHAAELCLSEHGQDCVTTISQKFPDCGQAISDDDLFVAVKTCEKFHVDRVPVVLNTWAKEINSIEFYSDKEDPSIPTINLGVPNTDKGHCGKTMAILQRVVSTPNIHSKKWLLIADDDTIINLARLQQLLACYDANTLVAVGERYGYMVSKGFGYDYITGGGGMVFSMPLVERLLKECRCPANDSPDDMIIGLCLRRMDVPITHVPYFHQARPDDYSDGYLSHQVPISFHKHWNCDPYSVYKLLKKYDSDGNGKTTDNKTRYHEEL